MTGDEEDLPRRVEEANKLLREALELLPWRHPVGAVQWVHMDQVQANDYNPNAVAHHEMKLLHTSISEDGYTQPIVTMRDEDRDRYIVVDGFHRYMIMRTYADVRDSTGGYLPIVVIDKPVADRIAATVRHNRARGKHSISGMSNLVFKMLQEGESDEAVCNKIGLEAEELVRLKHITGYSKLYADHEYTRPSLTQRQVDAKAKWAREHPDDPPPQDI